MQAWRGIVVGVLVAMGIWFLLPKSQKTASVADSSKRTGLSRKSKADVLPGGPPVRSRKIASQTPSALKLRPRPGQDDPSIEGPQNFSKEWVAKQYDNPVFKGRLPFIPHPQMTRPPDSVFEAFKRPFDPEKDKDRFYFPKKK
jgi:hypothetical protein